MRTFLAYLWRLCVIIFGFLLAVMAAAPVFILSIIGTAIFEPGPDGAMLDVLMGAFFMWLMTSAFTAMIIGAPVIILAVLAELFSWRGFLLHGVLGAVLGAGAALIGAPNDGAQAVLAGAAAGIVGAWIYWLVAGRNAGQLFDRIAAARRGDA